MSHTHARNLLHIVFATKNRYHGLRGEGREIAHNAIRRTAVEYDIAIDTIGGTEDHVHLLLQLPPKIAAAALVRALKAKSSKAMNDHEHRFAWQEGYGCFSVSTSNVDAVRRYIETQEENHRKRSFDEEYTVILAKNGFSIDPCDSPRAQPSSR